MATPKAEIIKRPIDQISSNLKKTAWSSIFEALALMILGILFVIWPDTMVKILAYLVGAFFIIKGGYAIANYYIQKGQQDFFNNGLLSGIVSILIGIVALVVGEDIAHIFRVIIGILIIYEALVRINTASKLYSVGVASWRYILALAIIMLVMGIIITFSNGAIISLIGVVMIITGIIGLVGDVIFIQHVNAIVDKLTTKEK